MEKENSVEKENSAVIVQLKNAGITNEMLARIAVDSRLARVVHDALVTDAKNGGGSSILDNDVLTIASGATAEGLIAEAKAEFVAAGIPLTYFNEDLLQLVRQDLELVRGEPLRVHEHNFGRPWETKEGRDWQQSVEADGNAAAYIAVVGKTRRVGYSTSIAKDDSRLFPHGGALYAPHFYRDGGRREFYLPHIHVQWPALRALVAFSAI